MNNTVDISKSKYFMYIAIAFTAVLLVSNTIAVKLIGFGQVVVAGAIIIFPISYIFGDILTEVYGYKASRKVIWAGFVALIFMSLCYWIVDILPAAYFWGNQDAYHKILGAAPRITFASLVAYFVGEFMNSYVISRMKVAMEGKYLWMRTIASTLVGEGVDSVIFGFIAFYGMIPTAGLVAAIASGYLLKVVYEVLATPITYSIVRRLKKAEGLDVYDVGVAYNPFSIKGYLS